MNQFHTSISDFKEGVVVYGFYYCNEKNIKYSKNGDKYLDISITDNNSSVYGKIWNHVDYFNSKFNPGSMIAVKGKIIQYRNRLELNILNINSANVDLYSKYGFKKSLIN